MKAIGDRLMLCWGTGLGVLTEAQTCQQLPQLIVMDEVGLDTQTLARRYIWILSKCVLSVYRSFPKDGS